MVAEDFAGEVKEIEAGKWKKKISLHVEKCEK